MTTSQPLRVLWVIKGLGRGGAERLLVSIARARDTAAVEYEAAYVLPWKDSLVVELEAAGVPTRLLGSSRGLGDPGWPIRLHRLLSAGRYDVVHVHSPSVAAVVRPMVRFRPHRPRLVVTAHNVVWSHRNVIRLADALTCGFDDAHLAVSDEVRASMRPRRRRHTEVVTHGIPVTEIRSRRPERDAARAELGFASDDVIVATVANLRSSKDYETLLSAAALAIEADRSLRFVAVGNGPLESVLHATARRLGLDDRFTFLGHRTDPVRVLVGSDVFTLSSRHEGLPIAMLEAMAAGLPVVATRVGGIPSVVREGEEGLLAPAGRPELLAQAYVRLAAAPATRQAMGERAARRAEEYDIVAAARRIEAIYARVVARAAG